MDIELVMTLKGHIEQPCEDEYGNNLRLFYLRQAREVLPKLKNPFAKEILEKVIEKYK